MIHSSQASEAQAAAADPAVSAFVAASAGSGKTKLLIDRLLRLLLRPEADPARIQCLTYTRAAAAEMALRLQATLARWVTLPEAELRAEVALLQPDPAPALLARARALFATVLDLPGGMRIGTLHAFCQSLLRRFPLEAAISPHFRVIEAFDAASALHEASESALAAAYSETGRADLDHLAGLADVSRLEALIGALQTDRERLAALGALGPEAVAAAQRRVLGAPTGDAEAALAAAVVWPEAAALRATAEAILPTASPTITTQMSALLGWLDLAPTARQAQWAVWQAIFLTTEGEPRKQRGLLSAKLAASKPELWPVLAAEQERLLGILAAQQAMRLAAVSAALWRLARPAIAAFERGKSLGGWLDYQDLIVLTTRLLADPGAAWVLYKLDGGIDHLLLDEAQDTAPAQWAIVGRLCEEFFAGQGARPQRRTVFAVGDPKQSIYSFQGAVPGAFADWRDRLAAQVKAAGEPWVQRPLTVSFRSTEPVLALVDAVFAGPAGAGLAEPGGSVPRHQTVRTGEAGSVELWPLAALPAPPPREAWRGAVAYRAAASPRQLLAERLARWLRARLDAGERLPSRGRALAPGDVLILLRRRDGFARALLRALKQQRIPVAGLDRMVLTEQPAVADLLTLCDTLLLPEDDFSLACVLTSPLGGLDDPALMALAVGRPSSLWEALRARAGERADWRAAWDFLAALFARVDFTTPHALLAEALGPLGGRARLLARLGPEADEPMDELLHAALHYTESHPPALQGFLLWLRRSGAEVKREAEAAGGRLRIMTVHGAKGLQAPLVILPDTTALPKDDAALLWAVDRGAVDPTDERVEVPLWIPRRALRAPAAEAMLAAARQRQLDEHNRLLYVALTRAEDRLVVCGWPGGKTMPDACWYARVRDALAGMPDIETVREADFDTPLLRLSQAQTAPPRATPALPAAPVADPLPSWAGAAPGWRAAPPPGEPALPEPLAPSRPEGAALAPVPAANSPLSGRPDSALPLLRGKLLHALLQHLPALAEARREAAAREFLARPGHGLAPAAVARLVEETLAILRHPALAPLFGPGSRAEVPLTGVIGGRVIGGLVDRLAVGPTEVLLADYKTNRAPPAHIAATPLLYLRQMAAYRAVLAAIFPGRAIRCFLVWTQAARIDLLDDALLDAHTLDPARGARHVERS